MTNIGSIYFDFETLQFSKELIDEDNASIHSLNNINNLIKEKSNKDTTRQIDFEISVKSLYIVVIVDKVNYSIYNKTNKIFEISDHYNGYKSYFNSNHRTNRHGCLLFNHISYKNNEKIILDIHYGIDEYIIESKDPSKIIRGYEISQF